MALLVVFGPGAGSAGADPDHDLPLDLPPPPESEQREPREAWPEMERVLEGGNARRYTDGESHTYRMTVRQRLQPHGLYEAGSQASRLEMVLTETVKLDGDEPVVTLRVTEASAEGFLAEAEELAARNRTLVLRPSGPQTRLVLKQGPDGRPNLMDPEAIAMFGELGHIRMVDMALRAHLLNPALPAGSYRTDETFPAAATLPAGWTNGFQSFEGGVTVAGEERREGRRAVRMTGVQVSSDTLLRVRAMDNAVEALQGLV